MKSLILISFLTSISVCSAGILSSFGVCSSDEFKCTSGECISKSSQCNMIHDCSDGSDERLSVCKESISDAIDVITDGATGIATGAIVGIAVGSIGFLLLICLCCYCCCCRRRGGDVIIQNNPGYPSVTNTVVMTTPAPAPLPMPQPYTAVPSQPYPSQHDVGYKY